MSTIHDAIAETAVIFAPVFAAILLAVATPFIFAALMRWTFSRDDAFDKQERDRMERQFKRIQNHHEFYATREEAQGRVSKKKDRPINGESNQTRLKKVDFYNDARFIKVKAHKTFFFKTPRVYYSRVYDKKAIQAAMKQHLSDVKASREPPFKKRNNIVADYYAKRRPPRRSMRFAPFATDTLANGDKFVSLPWDGKETELDPVEPLQAEPDFDDCPEYHEAIYDDPMDDDQLDAAALAGYR